MIKSKRNFLAAMVLAATTGFVGVPDTANAQDTIKIGEINHYKRMAAFAGPYKNGIELALEEVNGAGGVLGKPLEFIFRDDQGKPCLLYTSPSPRDKRQSRMPSSA